MLPRFMNQAGDLFSLGNRILAMSGHQQIGECGSPRFVHSEREVSFIVFESAIALFV